MLNRLRFVRVVSRPEKKRDLMPSEPIDRPGTTIQSTLAEILGLQHGDSAATEWRDRMQSIETSERSAETESASVRIR
jgi:hypothetical protein